MKRFLKSQAAILFFGFAFWLPVVILIFIVSLLVRNAEGIGNYFLDLFFPQISIHQGFGIVTAIVVIYLSGLILKLTRVGKLFSHIPILSLFFGGGEIMTIDRLIHLQPCLFALSPSCLSYGWILSEEKVNLYENNLFDLVNVYYPNVPTLLTGQVFPVRKETVVRLGNTSKEIIDLLLYAFRSPKEIKYLPWEGESKEDFSKRAREFGLNIDPNMGK